MLGAETLLAGGPFLATLPLYAPERSGRTAEELWLVEQVRRADAVILGSPGYHGGVSGLVKNAVDLIEETAKDARPYLEGRAVGLVVTAYGWQATGTTLSSLRSIVHALRGWPTPYGAALNAQGGLFDDADRCKSPDVEQALKTVARQVVDFAARMKADKPR
jgi:FMN reductase